jgi:hypothetical protein
MDDAPPGSPVPPALCRGRASARPVWHSDSSLCSWVALGLLWGCSWLRSCRARLPRRAANAPHPPSRPVAQRFLAVLLGSSHPRNIGFSLCSWVSLGEAANRKLEGWLFHSNATTFCSSSSLRSSAYSASPRYLFPSLAVSKPLISCTPKLFQSFTFQLSLYNLQLHFPPSPPPPICYPTPSIRSPTPSPAPQQDALK